MSADAGEIVVCNVVFRLSIYRSVPEIFAIEVRSRPKSRQKAFCRLQFFWGTAEISRWIKKEKRKKETAAKHKDRSRVATGGPKKILVIKSCAVCNFDCVEVSVISRYASV